MNTFDLSPLYRSAIGFDRLAEMLMNTQRGDNGYPPYNIEAWGDDRYRITMAVAGFSDKDLEIVVEQNTLRVTGSRPENEGDEQREVLYRGIANRAFERRFQLADHVKVVSARLENGLLHIDLKRELPEQMKPRKIEITTDSAAGDRTIEGQAKAA